MDLPKSARVVIIGGGVVGASCLYHLAKAGWTDCVLVEKNELTAGSTWHAAGNIPTFSSSWSIMNMQRYSCELYRELGERVDYPMNYHVTGSLRLGHTEQRRQEFERVYHMGQYQDMDLEMLTPTEAKERYPFMETHDLTGVLYDPYDGDIDPAQLTQAFAKGARDLGAKIFRFCPATGAKRDGDEWVVSTEKGDIRCEFVVNAAGYYAQEVGRWFGREVPMMVMSHQYLLFDNHEKIEKWSADNGGKKLPLLRDVDSSYYLRQEKYGLNLGPYERNCKAHWDTPDDPMPDDFSFQLYPDDLERLEWYLNDAIERVPLMGEAGMYKVINGPIPYTPDGLPLIGPMPGIPNAFEACVFTFGICQAGGAGKVLTEWMQNGETEWDMWSCDPRRFTSHTDHDYCVAKGKEVYGHEYAMHYPHYEWPEGRNKKLSPNHQSLIDQGAVFGAFNGWERATWFAQDGDDTSLEATETWRRNGPWEQRVRAECEAVRDTAGLLDMAGFSRYTVKGAGAREWLNEMMTGNVPKAGRIGLGYFANEKGKVLTEMSIIAYGEDDFLLMTAAIAQWHDLDWLNNNLPANTAIEILDVTDQFCCQLLTGPNSRAILADISDGDLSKGWLTHQNAVIADSPVQLFRVSYAGELGWEIHSPIASTGQVHAAIVKAGKAHGMKPFGMIALNSLRLEKGYRTWKGDLSTDYTVLQTGLDRFINFDKPAFKGRDAVIAERDAGVTKRAVTLVVDLTEYDPPYMSNVRFDGKIVGEVTSGGWGYRVNKMVALAMVDAKHASEGTKLTLDVYNQSYDAVVQSEQPLWDPANERLRG